ncbi:MAG: threonine synthase [Gammaproteobacteria bacterium]
MKAHYQLIDFISKKPVIPNGLVFAGEDSPWEVQMDISAIKAQLDLNYFKMAPAGLAKYLPFMPIKKNSEFVSLKETATPLIKSQALGKRLNLELYFKVEGKNPTGSFKDRGSAVDITVAREFKAPGIVLASTGNMAASCACYAAAAKIPCFIFVPEGVAVAKLAQVIAYGGRIVQIKGTYNDAATLALSLAHKLGFYLAGDYAYRVEGQKTAAFEMIDQLFYQAPDWVVVPIGCGTNMTAYKKGFSEYQQLGLINQMPQLLGVQAEGAAAVVHSYQKHSQQIEGLAQADTLASAIAVPNPIDGVKALEAIYSTNGSAVAVSDSEILQAQYLLSTEEGLFVESASAATIAALIKSPHLIPPGSKVVCVLTGDGLKDAGVVLKAAIKPATIYPNDNEFLALYQNNFFKGKSMIFVDKNQVLFEKKPSIEDIRTQITTLIGASYSEVYLVRIQSILDKILTKGKAITVSDFQDSMQDALEMPLYQNKAVFSVQDFTVTTRKDRVAEATVTVKIAGEEYQATAEGTGPVDAIIKALSSACHTQIDFKLTEYKVEIRSHGTDAVVYVELKLVKNQAYSLGCGTSPDIVQASIEAFEEAYNGFV